MRRNVVQVLIAYAPPSDISLTLGHWANQSWVYPLNAERLARKQTVLFVCLWYGAAADSNPQPPYYEANALTTGPPRVQTICFTRYDIRQKCIS